MPAIRRMVPNPKRKHHASSVGEREGRGKTTSCIYLAAVLARRGIEVAVYDADPQSSASLWAAAAEQAGDPLPFDVLPANMATLAHLGGDPAAREWSIIDAPPQGPLLDKTLAVADFVIVPTSDSPMDLQQAWDTLDCARHATRAALLPVRVEANTNAWAQPWPRWSKPTPRASTPSSPNGNQSRPRSA